MKTALSIAFEDLRGKAGTLVISRSRSGLVLKPRVSPKNPKTPAQQAIRADMAKAGATYKALTAAQVVAWKNFAATQTRTNKISGEPYSPSAINAFSALATKFLQATPGGTIPTNPPSSSFAGDTVTLSYGLGSPGNIAFTANHANAAGIVTEILLQPLASANRTPSPQGYRSKLFTSFALSLTVTIPVPAGNYAAAYRFVNTATGQMTEPITLAIHQVTLALAQEEPTKKAA